jgi:hypothetical protein
VSDQDLYNTVHKLAAEDGKEVEARDKSYGSSWKKRGGVGAFMMLARKWDRIEKQAETNGWDIFTTIRRDPSANGILDDIRDLRRYLLLVEAELTPKVGPTLTNRNPWIPIDGPLIFGGQGTSVYREEDAARAAAQLSVPAGATRPIIINENE